MGPDRGESGRARYPRGVVPATAPVHRLSVDDVHRMVASGVLDEDDRIELVHGVLVDMVPIGAEHDGAVGWLGQHFSQVGSPHWRVRVQCTLLVAGGYVVPDLILVEPLPRSVQPSTALLVVEVAQTSQARDRDKARDYAAADVPDYWIVDLPARRVTVHRSPLAGTYQEITVHADGETIESLVPDAPPVAVTELLG